MSLTNGPSAKALMTAGGQTSALSTGRGMGRELVDDELEARAHFAAPSVPGPNSALSATEPSDTLTFRPPASSYNYMPGLPVKYDVPTAQKERMQARLAVRAAASTEERVGGADKTPVIRTDPITEGEVDYLQSMKDQAELARFDRYVNAMIDPRKPGNLKWLMEIYPEYVMRRVKQSHTNYDFAMRNEMIDSWGINTFDDLHFKYMNDQGKIDGPRLGRHKAIDDAYAPGLLSVWAWMGSGQRNGGKEGLYLPFASAQVGRRPADNKREEWLMKDDGAPLSHGTDYAHLAYGMFNQSNGTDARNNLRYGAAAYGAAAA